MMTILRTGNSTYYSLRILLSFIVFLFIRSACAQIPLGLENKENAKSVEEFTYKFTPQGNLSIYIHYPPEWTKDDTRSVILYFCEDKRPKTSLDPFLYQAQYLAQRGMVAARADYRAKKGTVVPLEKCVEDAKSAVRWLRENTKKLGIDPDRIAAAGEGAGGHLAACASTVEGCEAKSENHTFSSKPNLLILFNPVLNLSTADLIRTTGSPETARLLSPNLNLSTDTAPTLLLYGTKDPLLVQGQVYVARANRLGVPATLYAANNVGFGFFKNEPFYSASLFLVHQFLWQRKCSISEPFAPASMEEVMREIPASECAALADKTGEFRAQFVLNSPFSNLRALSDRMQLKLGPRENGGHYYNIKEESFKVYVPDSYNPQNPYGLLVNISPGKTADIPLEGFKSLIEKMKFVVAGADKSGNQEEVFLRRIPLALDAAYNMRTLYNIDSNRIYVFGVSGGGRVSSMTAFHHPDVWAGGLFIIGANYWSSMSKPSNPVTAGPPRLKKPFPNILNWAANHGRYVLLTGDYDANREEMYTYYRRSYSKILKNVIYLQVPNMGHEAPDISWFERALKFLDDPSTEKKN